MKRKNPLEPDQLLQHIKTLKKKVRELRGEFIKFNFAVQYPKVVAMWTYPCDGSTYSMESLQQRTLAANSLGYDVRLVCEDNKMRVEYIAKRPKKPYCLEMDYYCV